MTTTRLFLAGFFAALLGSSIPGRAEDIDLYSSVASVTGTDLPNVLFVLDTAGGFHAESSLACSYDSAAGGGTPSMDGKAAGIEQCALVNAISALKPGADGAAKINVGIMLYNKSGLDASCPGGEGGCLVYPLTGMTAANKTALIDKIKAWQISGIDSISTNSEATGSAMQEAWAYYAGKTGMSGRTYTAPSLSGCQKNYVIFIGNAVGPNGSPGDGGSASPSAKLTTTVDSSALTADQKNLMKSKIQIASGTYGTSAFKCGGGTGTVYTMNNDHNTDGKGLYADEWARYMHEVDLKLGSMPANRRVFTYTIGVLDTDCKPEYPALLTSMAVRGGGKYFATSNAADITQAILRALNEMQAVNSVFSSSSLPVSVNTQGTYLNQIFMGMFRPDGGGNPRWVGNLKQYKFKYDPTLRQISLVDALGFSAISKAGTGFLSPDAASYWTCGNSDRGGNDPALAAPYDSLATCNTDLTAGFWRNNMNGTALAYDLPDGEMVEKGGAAQMLRLANLRNDYTATPGSSSNPRKLYTCMGCSANDALSGHPIDSTNAAITDAALGTGPRSISSITSKATVQGTGANGGGGGTAASVSITQLSKPGNSTVTATVSATDLTKLHVGTQLKIATGATKFDCNPCEIATVDATNNTFTYSKNGGSGKPTLPSTATLFSNYFWIKKAAHGLSVGQTVTISGCSTAYGFDVLNGTVATVYLANPDVVNLAVSTYVAASATDDPSCDYTPNTATVTTSGDHGFATGTLVAIAGATPTGYNGSWVMTATGTNTFTYEYAVPAPLTPFNGAGATATSSGTSRVDLLRWLRGEDNYGDEASLCPPGVDAGVDNCPATRVNVRPSLHGDVLHSRPVVLNYGGTNGVIVFYGANDGIFRAVNGNQTASVSSTPPGGELWGFIPEDFFEPLKNRFTRQHDNSPMVLTPSTPTGIIPAPTRRDYFVDGSTGVYQVIKADGTSDEAILYLVMRRGGRLIYALDVGTPTNPKFLWRHKETDTGFGELGQTWSQPKVAKLNGYGPNPVVIFGAGYDASAEDTEPPTPDSMGRGIFILDAFTGAPVWTASYGGTLSCPDANSRCTLPEMKYSIPSDITLVDHDSDGKVDRLLVGDVGGNLWRVDLEPYGTGTCSSANKTACTSENWKVQKLAALGCDTGICPSGTTPRKILYPPEVISTNDGYDAVFVATGDREHPLYSTATGSACTTTNRAYLLKDTGSTSTITQKTWLGGDTYVNNLHDADVSAWDGSLSGYYITFAPCEKSVNAPLVVAGYIYFGTNRAKAPETEGHETCEESLGEASGYKLWPFSGKYVGGEFEGGGLPPSPVAGIVNITDTLQVAFCIGCGGGEDDDEHPDPCASESPLEGCIPPLDVSTNRKRTYWYIKGK